MKFRPNCNVRGTHFHQRDNILDTRGVNIATRINETNYRAVRLRYPMPYREPLPSIPFDDFDASSWTRRLRCVFGGSIHNAVNYHKDFIVDGDFLDRVLHASDVSAY